MKILYVTGEAAPFITSGGLGEVMGTLPKAIKKCDEDTVCEVIMPLYGKIEDEYKRRMEKVIDLTFNLAWRKTGATVYRLSLDNVTYYFIHNSYYCDRPGIYGEYDDGERFAFFSKAVIEFILNSENIPDILHANDWQTALCPIYLKTSYCDVLRLKNVKTVFTIHNIEYQGKYDPKILKDVFDLEENDRNIVEYDGFINLMKGGIVCADAVTTVSKNYANELEYDYYSFGLSNIIRENKTKIYGVINGIDYEYYSPDKGGDIYFPFTRRAYKSGKAANKRALQKELSLEVAPEIPLAVMITRLVSQKGVDLFLHIAKELCEENIQIVVLGTGDECYENQLLSLNGLNNFKAIIKFDRVLAKKLYAASDIFIMPSKYEPCGLAQMIAMSYGSVPVARRVGGIADTVTPYGCESANGFLFDNYNAHELLYTLKLALAVYKDKIEWLKLTKNAIKSMFNWNSSASEYMSIYKNITKTDGENEG